MTHMDGIRNFFEVVEGIEDPFNYVESILDETYEYYENCLQDNFPNIFADIKLHGNDYFTQFCEECCDELVCSIKTEEIVKTYGYVKELYEYQIEQFETFLDYYENMLGEDNDL